MNVMFKMGSIFALFVTICKIVGSFAMLPILGFVAGHSSFFYGCAVGIIVGGLTKRLWLILAAIVLVYVLLIYVGF